MTVLQCDDRISGYQDARFGNNPQLRDGWNLVWESLHSADAKLFPNPDPIALGDEFGSIGLFALDYILLKAPHVNYLGLQIPRCIRSDRPRPDPRGRANWYSKMRSMYQQAIQNAPGGVLPTLVTVVIISDTEENGHSLSIGLDETGLETRHPTLELDFRWWLQSLEALVLVKDNIQRFEVFGHSLSQLAIPPNVKLLKISGFLGGSSDLSLEENLFHSGSHPPDLKVLCIRAFPGSWGTGRDNAGLGVLLQQEDMDSVCCQQRDMYHQGLMLYRDTLFYLDLQTLGMASSLSATQGPRGQALRCLPAMSKLRHLTIELGMLFSSGLPPAGAQLQHHLPPRLESLVLIERWHPWITCRNVDCQKDCLPASPSYPFLLLQAMADWSRVVLEHQPFLVMVSLMLNPAWKLSSLTQGPVVHLDTNPIQPNPVVLADQPDQFHYRSGWKDACLSRCQGRRARNRNPPGCRFLSHERLQCCIGPEITWRDVFRKFLEYPILLRFGLLRRGWYHDTELCPL